MGVRERICAIRLVAKVQANPKAAEKLGITVIHALCSIRVPGCPEKKDRA